MAGGSPVTIVDKNGAPFVQVDGDAPVVTAIESGGLPITLVEKNAPPIVIDGATPDPDPDPDPDPEPEPEPDLFLSADELDYGTFRIPAGVVAMRAVLRGADGADDGDNRGGQGATLEVLFEGLENNEQYEHWITGIGDEDETSLWATNDPDDTWAMAGAGANADGGPGSGYPAQDNIAYGCTILENTSGVDGGADGVTGSIAVYFITD